MFSETNNKIGPCHFFKIIKWTLRVTVLNFCWACSDSPNSNSELIQFYPMFIFFELRLHNFIVYCYLVYPLLVYNFKLCVLFYREYFVSTPHTFKEIGPLHTFNFEYIFLERIRQKIFSKGMIQEFVGS